MLFGTYDLFRADLNNATLADHAEATSHAMQDAWVAFAARGPAGLEKMGWPRYTGNEQQDQVEFFGGDDVPMRTGNTRALEKACPVHAAELGE